MNSKSLRRMVQTMKSSRVRYAAIFASLVLILVFSAVQASGPMRPPHPPMPPQNHCMGGMQMPSWSMEKPMPSWDMQMPMPSWGMQMPNCQPWYPWYPQLPVPKIHIYLVVENEGVIIETENFPENENFTVTMGEMYTRGVDGIVVGTFNSGDGSPQFLGFRLPVELQDEERVAIRAQSDQEYPYYYYAFNWFYNATFYPEDTTDLEAAAPATFEEAVQATESAVPPTAPPTTEETSEETPAAEETTEGVGGAEGEEAASVETELIGAAWQWTGFSDPEQGDLTIDTPEQYTVVFLPEGLVGVKADCNNGNGTYITDDAGGIDIAIGIVTAAACAPESLSDQFLQYLGEVAVYSFDEDGNLILDLPADSGTMTFAAGAAEDEAEAPAEEDAAEDEAEAPAEEDAAEGEAEAPAEEAEAEAAASVTGEVTYLQRIALPDDAVVNVQVQDTSLADAPAVVMGEQTIETAGQQVPIPYEVTYNPDEIVENHTYTVRAQIEDGEGNLLFTSDTAILVISNGNPTEDVEIVTVPVAPSEEVEAPAEEAAEAEEETTLTGVVWNWAEFADPVQGSLAIEDPSLYTVEFLEDGTVGIKADCNNGSGSYVADEAGAIDITVGAVTLALCDEDSLSDQFIQYLDAAVIYFFDSDDLLFDLPVDSGTLRLTAADAEAGATAKLASIALMPVAGGGGDDEVQEEVPVPSFTICVVERDETVSIVGENFPAEQTFAVKMGVAQTYMPMYKHPMPPKPMPYHGSMNQDMSMGMGMGMGMDMGMPMGHPGGKWMKPAPKVWIPYYEAGTLETGAGGEVEGTFEIPAELAGAYKISIMMRTDHQFPYISYNWFYNNDADVCNGETPNG